MSPISGTLLTCATARVPSLLGGGSSEEYIEGKRSRRWIVEELIVERHLESDDRYMNRYKKVLLNIEK